MKRRTARIDFRGTTEHRHEANDLVAKPGEAVLVHRGVNRSVVMACPDGCGEMLTINLDRRSGPAWRFYQDAAAVSMYPSVWRTTGCKSHFIVWRSRIYCCDWHEELEATDEAFEQAVMGRLTPELRQCIDVADQLGAVPWAVLVACNRLRNRGLVQSGVGDEQDCFRLASGEP
ncbi:MAG: DUF6527 family protein [Rhizobacter sp.]